MIRDVTTSTLLTSRDRINCLAARSPCDRRVGPVPCKCTSVGLHLFPESMFVSRPCLSCWYRGCPCRDPPVCRRVQGDSVATRQPWLCVCWSRDVVCVPCARVRGRASRSCATENTYTPARLEALSKLSVVAIYSPSYHFDQIFCGLWVLHLVQDLIEMLLFAVCSVAIHLVHANTNLFVSL